MEPFAPTAAPAVWGCRANTRAGWCGNVTFELADFCLILLKSNNQLITTLIMYSIFALKSYCALIFKL